MDEGPQIVHSSCVALAGRGLLILGRSGSGKSTLALQLMALGAVLVSDDRTCVSLRDGALWAEPPAAISGLIEARGVGLLAADPAGAVPLVLAVDLDRVETDRLPPWRELPLMGQRLPLVWRVAHEGFAAAILQYLKKERSA